MTKAELVARVMARTGQSSTTAQTRIGQFVDERYLRAQTSINLARLRRGLSSFTIPSGAGFVTISGIAKIHAIYDPTHRRVLHERSLNDLRVIDPGLDRTGPPTDYVLYDGAPAGAQQIFAWPVTDEAISVRADVTTAATTLGDNDSPNVPADFHDLLIRGACADEFAHLQKPALEKKEENAFEQRLADLRYWMVKSPNLPITQAQWHSSFSGPLWTWVEG